MKQFNYTRFAEDTREKITKTGNLRKASKECGVSYSQLSRIITHASFPSINVFLKLSEWMEVGFDDYVES